MLYACFKRRRHDWLLYCFIRNHFPFKLLPFFLILHNVTKIIRKILIPLNKFAHKLPTTFELFKSKAIQYIFISVCNPIGTHKVIHHLVLAHIVHSFYQKLIALVLLIDILNFGNL